MMGSFTADETIYSDFMPRYQIFTIQNTDNGLVSVMYYTDDVVELQKILAACMDSPAIVKFEIF